VAYRKPTPNHAPAGLPRRTCGWTERCAARTDHRVFDIARPRAGAVSHNGPAMNRFAAIEGLRGWLAWTVVIGHIALVSHVKGIRFFAPAAEYAVLAFVVISGFVITHLILERRELLRGLHLPTLRIFPLFAVTCIIGYFTTPLFVEAATKLPWRNDTWFAVHAETVRQQSENFWRMPSPIFRCSMELSAATRFRGRH
jgi:hypothetical protein